MKARRKRRVLLVAEAVTLAHFARIVTLAKALNTEIYDVIVATDPRYLDLEASLPFSVHPIWSIPSAEFAYSLARGKLLYDVNTLERYVEDDLSLLDQVKPDLVVGDFRLSLAVSAPLRQIPYAAVVNAYWSPYAETTYPVPDLPVLKHLGNRMAQRVFDTVRPFAFALHARPLNRLRRRHGLQKLGDDLCSTYSWGNFTLYPDAPELFPTRNLPKNHHYIGPVTWSTNSALPRWWNDLPGDKPIVFVTMGSSGSVEMLPRIVDALAELPIVTLVATAGCNYSSDTLPNTFTTDFLPMEQALSRACLLVCNGGSLSTYQALSGGVPVLGIATNMDQLLNMEAVVRSGAGLTLRAANTCKKELKQSVSVLLVDPSFTSSARSTSRILTQYNSADRFQKTVSDILPA